MQPDSLGAARPLFRRVALAVAIICFLLAGLFSVVIDNNRFAAVACLVVGFVMLTIAQTGHWPPKRRRSP